MNKKKPGFLKMIRAPFLSSIISPLVAGSLLAFYITEQFEIVNFIIVFIMGICLHIATNVYNDIYDTIQGPDRINVHRNEFSGGSGVLVDYPELMPTMLLIARIALVGTLITTIALFFRIQENLRLYLLSLFLLSAFFSKYYTAAPLKLAYRGLGEVSVWFAFGPMAVFVSVVSQNVGLHPTILVAMPITGISTLSILLIGQIIDWKADKDAGKWGVAVRLGIRTTSYIYFFVQLFLCLNVICLSLFVLENGWLVLVALIPYTMMLPRIIKLLIQDVNDSESHKKAAGLNVFLHLIFSILFTVGLILTLLV
jgi:1,4-dihydroxy-2-naphthoate octaprenyltransferase